MRQCLNCGEECKDSFCSHNCEADYDLAQETDPVKQDDYDNDFDYDDFPAHGEYEDFYPEPPDCDLWHEF